MYPPFLVALANPPPAINIQNASTPKFFFGCAYTAFQKPITNQTTNEPYNDLTCTSLARHSLQPNLKQLQQIKRTISKSSLSLSLVLKLISLHNPLSSVCVASFGPGTR